MTLESNPSEFVNKKWSKIQGLIEKTREPYWKLGILYVSVLTTLLLFIGAFPLFGLGEQTIEKLGVWGYVTLLLVSAIVAIAWFWGRKLYYYRLIVEELSKEIIAQPDFIASLGDDIASRNFAGTLLLKISSSPKKAIPFNEIIQTQGNLQKSQAASIIGFLRDLRLLTVDEHLLIRPVNTWASGFMVSMAYYIRDGMSFFGDWQAHGSKAQRLRGIVKEIEERRLKLVGKNVAEPSRLTKAAIIIFKSKYKDNDVYLMQWSTAWSPGRYWFIGGVMEPDDNSIQECAFRELDEELDLRKSDINELREICSINDRRLSDRLGLFTEYDYHIFFGSLNTESKHVQSLFKLEFEIETLIDWVKVERKNKWIDWEQIYSDSSLRQDADIVLDKLNDIIKFEPLSSNLMVSE